MLQRRSAADLTRPLKPRLSPGPRVGHAKPHGSQKTASVGRHHIVWRAISKAHKLVFHRCSSSQPMMSYNSGHWLLCSRSRVGLLPKSARELPTIALDVDRCSGSFNTTRSVPRPGRSGRRLARSCRSLPVAVLCAKFG